MRTIRRRTAFATAVVFGLVAWLVTVGQTARSAPPQGAAPVNIADPDVPAQRAHVDEDGSLQVTGNVTLNGTSAVEVTNTPLPVSGDVTVTNFPSSQDVNIVGGSVQSTLSPVANAVQIVFNVAAGENELQTFATIDASTVLITDTDDEMEVHYLTPLWGAEIFAHTDLEGSVESFEDNFVQPIPLNGAHVSCANESEPCQVTIAIFGF